MATSSAPSGIADKRVFIPAADMTDSAPTRTGAPVLASVPARNPSTLHQPADKAGQQNPPPSGTQPVLASASGGTQAFPTPHHGVQNAPQAGMERESEREDGNDPVLFHIPTAALLQNQGRNEQAMEHYCKAQAIVEKNLATTTLSIATSSSQIAALLIAQARHAEALVLLVDLPALLENGLGIDHALTAQVHESIGLLLRVKGQYAQALEHCLKALAIREKIFGTDHPDTATTYNNIGVLLKERGDYTQALEYLFKALAILEKRFGTDDHLTVATYNNIGSTLHAQGSHAQALDYLLKVNTIRERVLGANHPATTLARRNMRLLLEEQNMLAPVLAEFRKALARAIAAGNETAAAIYRCNIDSLTRTGLHF